jgi:hypothetical protein
MMGVRGATPRCFKRPDPAYAEIGQPPLRDRLHPPSRQAQRLRGAELVRRPASGHLGLLARPPELGAIHPDAVQDHGLLDNVAKPTLGLVHSIPRDALRRPRDGTVVRLSTPPSQSGLARPADDGGDNGQTTCATPAAHP